jgi:hypothetical protein
LPNEDNLNAKCDVAAAIAAEHWREVNELAGRQWGVAIGNGITQANILYDMYVEATETRSLLDELSDLSGSRSIFSDAVQAQEILKAKRMIAIVGAMVTR